jgi:hypothetical protein
MFQSETILETELNPKIETSTWCYKKKERNIKEEKSLDILIHTLTKGC